MAYRFLERICRQRKQLCFRRFRRASSFQKKYCDDGKRVRQNQARLDFEIERQILPKYKFEEKSQRKIKRPGKEFQVCRLTKLYLLFKLIKLETEIENQFQ